MKNVFKASNFLVRMLIRRVGMLIDRIQLGTIYVKILLNLFENR